MRQAHCACALDRLTASYIRGEAGAEYATDRASEPAGTCLVRNHSHGRQEGATDGAVTSRRRGPLEVVQALREGTRQKLAMSANALLIWMSARRQGSWQQFRTAVEELHVGDSNDLGGEDDNAPDQFALSIYQTLRFNLQRLGHAEFFAGAGDVDWRVTPPSLAVTQHVRGWLGTLVGARSPTLLQRLHSAVEFASANMETLALPAFPDQFLIVADKEGSLLTVAERAGLVLQRDAPSALLTCLPSVDDPCVRHRALLPSGADWRIDRFSSEKLAWQSATLDDAASGSSGLFRFSLGHQRHMLFCVKGGTFQIPGQVGKYLVLGTRRHRRQVLRYEGHKPATSMHVPYRRALCLSTMLQCQQDLSYADQLEKMHHPGVYQVHSSPQAASQLHIQEILGLLCVVRIGFRQ